jgi:drug/metabolite transporter (DMT)-like permease
MPIVGAILIAAGLFLIVRPPSYTSEERVLKLGDIEARMQQERRVPVWVGGIALGAGVVLLVTGLTKRS